MSVHGFLPKNNGTPLYLQLKEALVNDIKFGKFENMQKLPSRRKLSRELNLSATTINNAYQALVDEGYAVTVDRSGFFVKSPFNDIVENDFIWEKNNVYTYNFSYNNCDSSALKDIHLKLFDKISQEPEYIDQITRHGNKRGEKDFRTALTKYLYEQRGISCSINEIFLGAGIQYLLTVLVMTLGMDKVYGFENPTDYKMYIWLKNLGLDIRLINISAEKPINPVELDAAGIDVMFVMPDNQLPTGRRMRADERWKLAEWCKKRGKYIVEVSTDGSLCYADEKPSSIYSLSNGYDVIYLESFEYTLSSNTKASFMVLPEGMIEDITDRLVSYSPLVTITEQRIYQIMINSGKMNKIIRHNNKIMGKKRQFLIDRVKSSKLGKNLKMTNHESGMNMLGLLDSPLSGAELTQAAFDKGVKIFEMNKFLLSPNPEIEHNAFVFGYAGLSIDDIDSAVSVLEQVWLR